MAIAKIAAETFRMREGSPSNTALWVAAQRALHQTVDGAPVFVDPLAPRLVESLLDLMGPARAAISESRRLRATLAARAVIAEAAIAQAAGQGVDQCVVLGAGLDTFAFRQGHPGLVVYELDHPSTQAAKRELLRRAEIVAPSSLRFIAANLATDDVAAVLAAAGFVHERAAVFMMMGVVPYLEPATLMRIVRALAESCADGSEIILDYTEPFDDAPPEIRKPYEAAAARVAAEGEPWLAYYHPDAMHAALRDLGYTIVADLDAAALDARCFADRTDGFRVAPLVHVLRARLRRNLQAVDASRHQGA